MNTLIKVPIEFIEMVAEFRLPPKFAARLRKLTAITDRRLTKAEQSERELLLKLDASLSRFRKQASHFLGRDLVA